MTLRVQASGYTIWGSGFSSIVSGGNPYDVSAYTGVSLWARSRTATPAQRGNWRLIGGGIGIHWPDLDEDLSVASLLSRPVAEPRTRGESAE